MEYLIEIRGPAIDLPLVREVLHGLDASAVADVDARRQKLRVSAALSVGDLLGLLEDAGLDVDERDIQPLPSVCCGGCGG